MILYLESHCNTIANFFVILDFYKFEWSGSFDFLYSIVILYSIYHF